MNLKLTPEMQKFLILLIAIVVILILILILCSGKSRFRRGVSMFLSDEDERKRQGGNQAHKQNAHNDEGGRKRPLTAGEAYYENEAASQKYSMQSQIDMVTLIRKSDDRLRVIESTGQTKMLDEYYELVFKNRKGRLLKIECSRNAYNAIPFNQQGSLTYKKNRLVKFKYFEGTVYND